MATFLKQIKLKGAKDIADKNKRKQIKLKIGTCVDRDMDFFWT